MKKRYFEFDKMYKLAQEIQKQMINRELVRKCEIVGSLRRRKEYVHDIELVAIPIYESVTDLFGKNRVILDELGYPIYRAESVLPEIIEPYNGQQTLFGRKLQKFNLYTKEGKISLEIYYVTPPATYGVIKAIRTGSADFSKWLVTSEAKGGALPIGYHVEFGAVWSNDTRQMIGFDKEIDFLEFTKAGWVEPKKREKGNWSLLKF